jgi:hypothetical protein
MPSLAADSVKRDSAHVGTVTPDPVQLAHRHEQFRPVRETEGDAL